MRGQDFLNAKTVQLKHNESPDHHCWHRQTAINNQRLLRTTCIFTMLEWTTTFWDSVSQSLECLIASFNRFMSIFLCFKSKKTLRLYYKCTTRAETTILSNSNSLYDLITLVYFHLRWNQIKSSHLRITVQHRCAQQHDRAWQRAQLSGKREVLKVSKHSNEAWEKICVNLIGWGVRERAWGILTDCIGREKTTQKLKRKWQKKLMTKYELNLDEFVYKMWNTEIRLPS